MIKRFILVLLFFTLLFSFGCIPDLQQTAQSSTTGVITYTQLYNSTTLTSSTTVTATTNTSPAVSKSITSTQSSSPEPADSTVSTPTEAIRLINRKYSWTYEDTSWTWELNIPQSLYDYYKGLPRSPTKNYSVYVTHPLADLYIKQITDKILGAAKQEGYSDFETISFAASFVQSLTYTSDSVSTGFDEYPRYPIETLVDNGGDCEDTAILAASLVRSLGFGTVLIVFPGVHCAVGVKGTEDIPGTYWEYKGDRYYYLETTNTGWTIGEIPDKFKNATATIYGMIPVPILTHDWTSQNNGYYVQLKITIKNLGSAIADGVYVSAGFDAGDGQWWNHKDSSPMQIGINDEWVVTVNLLPPTGKHTRIEVQIMYNGYAVDESYSLWFDT